MMNLILIFAIFVASVSQICGSNLSGQIKIKSVNNSNVCHSKDNWSLIANLEDCHKFYLCVNGIPEELICAAKFYFDAKDKLCKVGMCQSQISTHNCKPPSLRRIHDNCSVFSLCDNGEYIKQNCSAGHYFSSKYVSCQPITPSTDHKCSCLLPPYAVIGNPDDCETYYLCMDGKAVLQQCPRGHYFNDHINSCLPNFNGNCLRAPTISLAVLAAAETCRHFNNTAVGFQPLADECEKFFLCISGRAFTGHCPKGYYYDPITHFCQWDANGKCITRSQQILDGHSWKNGVGKPNIPIKSENISASASKEEQNNRRPQRKLKDSIKVGKLSNLEEIKTPKKEIENTKVTSVTEATTRDRDLINNLKDKNKEEGENSKDTYAWSSDALLQAVPLIPQKHSIYDKLSSKFINF